MKKILTALFVFSAFSAFAQTKSLPSADPVVKNLRFQFEDSLSPTSANLLGKKFHCLGKTTMIGELSYQIDYKTTFTSHDGMFLQLSEGDEESVLMVNNGREIVGVDYRDTAVYEAIRVTRKGDLIVEGSANKSGKKKIILPFGDVGEGKMVLFYAICVAKKR